jgi:hypothetical protein
VRILRLELAKYFAKPCPLGLMPPHKLGYVLFALHPVMNCFLLLLYFSVTSLNPFKGGGSPELFGRYAEVKRELLLVLFSAV